MPIRFYKIVLGFAMIASICRVAQADVVVLRSGLRLADVKAEPVAKSHRVTYSDGRVEFIPNSAIRSVRPAPTSWNQFQPAEPQKIPVEPQKVPDSISPRQEVVRPESPGFRLTPEMKSILVPGWGQYAQDRKGYAIAYAAAGALAFQQYWYYRQKHAVAERDYNDPVPVGAIASQSLSGSLGVADAAVINLVYLAGKEKTVYKLQNRGNAMIGLYGVIWALNVFDVRLKGLPLGGGWRGAGREAPRVQPFFYFQKDAFTAMLCFRI